MKLYLSMLTLNFRNRQVCRDLSNAYEMHRTLHKAFPPDGAGAVRFRLEPIASGEPPRVLVQSEKQPDWTGLPTDYLAVSAAVKPFEPPLFAVGRQLRFRLRANPTKRLRATSVGPDGRTVESKWHGKRIGLREESAQRAWLDRKAKSAGFRILECRVGGLTETCRRQGNDLQHVAALFDGVLEVCDPVLFQKVLCDGIGPAKGFGFGLLSVAPA